MAVGDIIRDDRSGERRAMIEVLCTDGTTAYAPLTVGASPTGTTAGQAVTVANAADVTQGALADAVVAAGATGSVSAKLRRLTTDLDAVKTSMARLTGGAGITASASFTPAAAAYTALDIMDVAKEFAFTYADGSAIPSNSLIRILTAVLKIDVTALQASEAAYQLQNYSVTPPSAQADNAAWTLASGDLPSYRGAIPLGTPVDLGSALYIKSPNIDLDIKLATASLFAELQTIAGFTATAVARQVFLYGVVL